MPLHLPCAQRINCVSRGSGAEEAGVGRRDEVPFLPLALLRVVDFVVERPPALRLAGETLERCSTFTLCCPFEAWNEGPAALLTREEPFSLFGTTRSPCWCFAAFF